MLKRFKVNHKGYEQDYSDYEYDKELSTYRNLDTITVKYEIRRGIERDDLPKSFSVLIDRKTKKTVIVSEEDIQLQSDLK